VKHFSIVLICFVQISMQRAVLYVKQHGKSHSESVASFVEEGVVRRELSDNFCYYNQHYDSIQGTCGQRLEFQFAKVEPSLA
jgi:deoxyribodipyrimidine photolyase